MQTLVTTLTHALSDIRAFIEQGGPIIWAVFVTCLLLWLCIIDRYWFYKVGFPQLAKSTIADWQGRRDHQSWRAYKIREGIISEVRLQLHARLSVIKTLIILCPLLGLLGTVTGMIKVFEIIAVNGTSNAQSMAQGVYLATIPTMAGLVVALSGYYFSVRLRQIADNETSKLADKLMLL
ncbi:MotA/TolQ/ExbB proton channel family protein [Alkalimarinus sediminis]|uniref:MotA/TolQ/ExbB proton channel family protein n=1 Tax=Alkalimarinus sediminis TaxID=1632866 RepID=A0A9E8HHT4_9ALTE|nr:MotA/TolQ/ExbB proton channel family protein [Alkalimarinus sediminis]UZW74938.1 MotA/TolQ/ExbB proton channel family protein [Alkalimarinus sediminis]